MWSEVQWHMKEEERDREIASDRALVIVRKVSDACGAVKARSVAIATPLKADPQCN